MSCGMASLFFVLGADLCWDGERFTLVFFELFDIVNLNRDVEASIEFVCSSVCFMWNGGTVESGLFRANNLEFSIGMGNG